MSPTDVLVMVAALTGLTFLIGGDVASLILKLGRRNHSWRPPTAAIHAAPDAARTCSTKSGTLLRRDQRRVSK